jgi:hypothetical protein
MTPLASKVRQAIMPLLPAVAAGSRGGGSARVRRALPALLLPALLLPALLLPALLLPALAGCASASSSSARPAQDGGYPSFLPSSTLHYHSDALLTGTAQRPALTSQGDGVEVKTPGWTVRVTVTGPQVPGEGLPYQAPATTCTWVVTMSGATGPVPVSVSDFSSIDDANHVYRPAFVPGQPKPPSVLRPGQKISFELRAVEAVGEGLMRWAPDGRNIVAKWDFVVEND